MTDVDKYIVIVKDGVETAITFPGYQVHFDVAREQGCKVVSAGFYIFDADPVTREPRCQVYGKSISLDGICSRPGDSQLILKRLRMI